MIELGVYVLGAVALGILAAAGIAFDAPGVVAFALLSAGAGYVAQVLAVVVERSGSRGLWKAHIAAMAVSLLMWSAGALTFIL